MLILSLTLIKRKCTKNLTRVKIQQNVEKMRQKKARKKVNCYIVIHHEMSTVCTSFQSIVHHSSSTEINVYIKSYFLEELMSSFVHFAFISHLSTRTSCVSLFFSLLSHYDEAGAYRLQSKLLTEAHSSIYIHITYYKKKNKYEKKRKSIDENVRGECLHACDITNAPSIPCKHLTFVSPLLVLSLSLFYRLCDADTFYSTSTVTCLLAYD